MLNILNFDSVCWG